VPLVEMLFALSRETNEEYVNDARVSVICPLATKRTFLVKSIFTSNII
jgi:hypothetical protein